MGVILIGISAELELRIREIVWEEIKKMELATKGDLNKLRADFEALRADVREEIGKIREEIGNLRAEVHEMRAEIYKIFLGIFTPIFIAIVISLIKLVFFP